VNTTDAKPVDFLFIKVATIFPPIAYACLAPHVTKLGLTVAIVDLIIDKIDGKGLAAILGKSRPRYVGINCLSFAANLAFDAAMVVKNTLPESQVIFGGHHVTALPQAVLENPHVDYTVRGEGEYSLAALLGALENNMPVAGLPGIGYKTGGRAVFNPSREFIENLDELPLPAYNLIDMEKYFSFSVMHGMRTRHRRFMPIFTSRGCPYKCIYCHHSEGLKWRKKSPERVLEEMTLLIEKYGIREFHIEDDTFNMDPLRAEKIMGLIAALPYKLSIQFPNGLRADLIDDELAVAMKKAGTFLVCLAGETGSSRIMDLIQKRLDLAKVGKVVDILVKHRILTWGYFMIGFPTETREEMQRTIDYACSLNLHFVSFSIVTPFPGTVLWDMVDTSGIDYRTYFNNLNYSNSKIKVSEVPAAEMVDIKTMAIRRFFSVHRIFRIAFHISGWGDIRYYWEKFKQRKAGESMLWFLRLFK
jgi:anaerobic magnesium-protoporphyrin IX monomethyl ester cyclase